MSLQPRYYQVEAVDALFDYFNERRGAAGNPLVALPTGTGKSIIIALFIYRALQYYPRTRIVILSHVKELLQQDYNKLREGWLNAPAGFYSAGLGRKEPGKQVLFAGIQSIANAPEVIGWVDLVIIDEAHLVSPEDETRYQLVIKAWRDANPFLKVWGTTATWWRQKQGSLIDGGSIFTDIAYDRTKPEDFQRFIAEGFLSPLVARATETKLDISDVSLGSNGDYNTKQLEAAIDHNNITQSACREVVLSGENRRAWLFFCAGIAHAEHVAELLNSWGIRTGVVHSKMPSGQRDEVLRDWYAGKLRAVTNNNVLTTGIDYPAIDLIAMLRPTRSSSLWVQMLGRGMRVSHGKANCLVLDFASNTSRLGPVDDPEIPGRPRPGPPGDAPVKICPTCSTYNYSSARYCTHCGHEFPTTEKLSANASDAPLMSSDLAVITTFKVDSVNYVDHMSRAGNRSIRAMYHCGLRVFSEYVAIGGDKWAGHKAKTWWMQRHHSDPPASVDDALMLCSELRAPKGIRVWVNTQYPEILSYQWEDYNGEG